MIKNKLFLFFILLTVFPILVFGQQWGEYTLYSVQNSTSAYLIDTNGTAYHSWSFGSQAKTGYSTYMIAGGTLVRTVARQGNSFNGGGSCGQIQKVDWDGNVLWDYVYSTSSYCSHHDICPMPNGNVLIIAWELKSSAEVTQAGCKYNHSMWPDKIVEVQQFGSTGGNIVWEWHAWDHLVQDYNSSKNNYGVVADHPELLDINFNNSQQTQDWMHVNGIDYNEELDQIVFSSHYLNELYVIDHSTTTAEAAGHTGGNSGKGGDFLYRWGNPAAYDAPGSTVFNVVHDAHWIPLGCPMANYIVAFNNNGISHNKSCIDIIAPPYNGYNYLLIPGSAYAPSTYTWRHPCNGHTNDLGTSQQLPNGNMLVSISQSGFIYEIDSNQTLLWSKNINGGAPNALRYSRCFVEGTVPDTPTITQQNDTLYSSSGATYRWFYNYVLIPGAVESFLVPEQIGLYQVAITNTSGCESNLSVQYYFEPTEIVESQILPSMMVYPIPTKGIIRISDDFVLDDLNEIRIFDRSGRIIIESEPARTFDLSAMENGIYFLVARNKSHQVYTSKIILIK